MKRRMIAGFIALSFLVPLPASAREITLVHTSTKLSPASLVTMAYRGYFNQQGVPSYLEFSSEYILGRITAERLVQTAVSAGLLPTAAVNDQGYLNVVRNQIETQLPIY
jgi:hypothetical protein